jgi:phosphonate transport system substrate-binding protein
VPGRPNALLTLALAPTLGVEQVERIKRAEPLAAYLERTLARPVRIVVEDSYAASLEALRTGRVDAAMLGELAALQAGAEGGVSRLVLPVTADGQVPAYRCAIFARLDSGIRDLAGVRGARIGLVDTASASGYRMPRAMLREAGLDPDKDVRTHLFGRHRAVVAAVLNGEVDVGATHSDALQPPSPARGAAYARLRVLATSRPIPRGPLVVRANLSTRLRRRLLEALLAIHQTDPAAAQVLNMVGGARFTVASRSTPPTLKSVAQLAGVSYATVSRVVNAAGEVAPETSRRVQAIIDELGYRPNGHALTLHGRKPLLVGIVVGSRHPPRTLVDRIRRGLAAAGVPLVLCPIDGSLGESAYLELLRDGRFGALVVGRAQALEPAVVQVASTGRVVIGYDLAVETPACIIRTNRERLVQTILAAL